MIGLPGDQRQTDPARLFHRLARLGRGLEFYSIKGAGRAADLEAAKHPAGDEIILRPKPVGTLVLDALLPGKRMWFLATGTGIAPFASLMRDPETYERYEQVIMMHTCRTADELAYGRELVENLKDDPLLSELYGEDFANRLLYYPTTRAKSPFMGRITDNLTSGKGCSRIWICRRWMRPMIAP